MLGISPLSTFPLSTVPTASAPAAAQVPVTHWTWAAQADDGIVYQLFVRRSIVPTLTPAVVADLPFTRQRAYDVEAPWYNYYQQRRSLVGVPGPFVPFVRQRTPDAELAWVWSQVYTRRSATTAAPPLSTFVAFRRQTVPLEVPWYGLAPWNLPRKSAWAVTKHIAGITRDAAGAPLGFCTVHLFRTSDDLEMQEQVSDAGGVFDFIVPFDGVTYYIVAYKGGIFDVAGTTVHSLVGV